MMSILKIASCIHGDEDIQAMYNGTTDEKDSSAHVAFEIDCCINKKYLIWGIVERVCVCMRNGQSNIYSPNNFLTRFMTLSFSGS